MEKHLDLLEKIACADGFRAWAEWPGDADSFALAHPDYALWGAGKVSALATLLTSARLDACAAEEPGTALEYAATLLTPERLDACAAERPGTALKYAATLLTSARLDACKICV